MLCKPQRVPVMKLHRIISLIIKNIQLTFRGLDPAVDFFYWPVYDILIWGFASKAVVVLGAPEPMTVALVSSLVAWQAVYRGNLDVSFNLLQEMWSRNIVNLFSSPVSIYEWAVSVMCVSLLNSTIAIMFGALAVWLLYGISAFSIGLIYIPIFLLLLLSGVSIGFFTASVLIVWGQKAQKLVWVMGWFFAPFSGVFYPLSVLPIWGKAIASLIPMSYLFTALRQTIIEGSLATTPLLQGLFLTIAYFALALLVFRYAFNKSRELGLARLQN